MKKNRIEDIPTNVLKRIFTHYNEGKCKYCKLTNGEGCFNYYINNKKLYCEVKPNEYINMSMLSHKDNRPRRERSVRYMREQKENRGPRKENKEFRKPTRDNNGTSGSRIRK
jgi:hypothetical protein